MAVCRACGALAGELSDDLCDWHVLHGLDNPEDMKIRRWMRSRGWLPEDEPQPPSTSKALKALTGMEDDSDLSSSDLLKSLMGMG